MKRKTMPLVEYVQKTIDGLVIESSFERSGLNKPDGTPKHNYPDDFLDGVKGSKSKVIGILSRKEQNKVKRFGYKLTWDPLQVYPINKSRKIGKWDYA